MPTKVIRRDVFLGRYIQRVYLQYNNIFSTQVAKNDVQHEIIALSQPQPPSKQFGISLCWKQYIAGSVYVVPVVGSTQGQVWEPKKAGLDFR